MRSSAQSVYLTEKAIHQIHEHITSMYPVQVDHLGEQKSRPSLSLEKAYDQCARKESAHGSGCSGPIPSTLGGSHWKRVSEKQKHVSVNFG